jgi:hypothetical protein
MTLDYAGRYEHQRGADHIVDAISIDSGRAVIASNHGLALVELWALPLNGTTQYIYWLANVHARNIYNMDDQYIFVNLFGGECEDGACGPGGSHGFSLAKIEDDTLRLIHIGPPPFTTVIDEVETLYEKMHIRGDYLYVTAHAKGIRIFSIYDPEAPVLVGRLDTGFVDAWAIAVEGDTAYVADGAGGLKIIDVSDPTAPVIVEGEDLDSAEGTSQDVMVRNGRIYVAAGGAGVAVYMEGDLESRQLHPVDGWAKDLDWIGDHLAVATYKGFTIYEPGPGTELDAVAAEIAQRRGPAANLRLCSAVGAAPNGGVLASNWDYMDVYELKPAYQSNQPDINCSVQRIRFHRNGGTKEVTVTNNGQGTLDITSVLASPATFTVDYSGGTLAPGEQVTFNVAYLGSAFNLGSGLYGSW